MIAPSMFEKNKLFNYLLNYIAKKDAEFTELTKEEQEISPLIFSFDDMKDEMTISEINQIEHFLIFIFLRNKKESLSEDNQKFLIENWNNVCDFRHTESDSSRVIGLYTEDDEDVYNKYVEFMDNIPVEILHEICLYDSSKNMDGTYCYYMSGIGLMGNHVIMTNMIKQFTRKEFVIQKSGVIASLNDINKCIELANTFLERGLSDKYENTLELVKEMLATIRNREITPLSVFYDYASRVPSDIIVIQSEGVLRAYKGIYEKEEGIE